ncbi:MAG TPA: glycosyltransferase family 1 protein [Herpetosiphonaceae bacterium]
MKAARRALVAAVPQLASYQGHGGIKRVFQSIRAHWAEQIQVVDASYQAYPLPLLRNFPFGVRAPAEAGLILLPQLTGAVALRKTHGLPSVAVIHDIGIVDFPGDRLGMSWLTHHTILRSFWALRYASRIIAVSGWTRERLLHYLPEIADRVEVVPSGVDPIFWEHTASPAAARARIAELTGGRLRTPLLVYVGSETPRKNLPLLLQAFKQVRQRHPDAQLLKVGGPGHPRWRSQTLEHAARLDLRVGHDLLLVDRVDDVTLADAYRAADLFVSASSYEGFGLPLLEAMACGTPAVTTDCGAFAEVAGDTGWLVPSEATAFAQAIDAALAAGDRIGRARAAQERARTWTWQRAAQGYIDILTDVAARSRIINS